MATLPFYMPVDDETLRILGELSVVFDKDEPDVLAGCVRLVGAISGLHSRTVVNVYRSGGKKEMDG